MTDHTALVFEVDPTVPPRRVTFSPERVLDVLTRELREEFVDGTSPLRTPFGPLTMFVGDASLLGDLPGNDRALAIVRAVGYPAPDVKGPAAFVGGVAPDGWHEGLTPTLVAWLESVDEEWRAISGRA